MEESILLQNQSLDFSFIALFLKATFTVKVVMLVLIFSSFWSWAIIIQKITDYRKSKREKKVFLDEFWSGGSLEELYSEKRDNPKGPCEQIFCAAMDEWQRSSTLINCLERSSFSNKLWLYDKEKGNPLAAWIKWKTGKHTFDTAIFSGTYDDYVGDWSDSKVYYASWLGNFSESSSYELHEYWLSYYKQDGEINQDRLAGGNDWAVSFVNRLGNGPWSLHSTLAFGDNGDQANLNREGSFSGLVLMPMYWLQENKLKLVVRCLYQEADKSQGLKLNSRYV